MTASAAGSEGDAQGTPQPAIAMATAIVRAPLTRRARAELGFALAQLPLAITGFAFTVGTLAAGAYFAVVLVGLPLLAASAYGARAFGVLHRRLARRLLDMRIDEPPPLRLQPGIIGWTRSGLTDMVAWRARLYLVLKLPVAIVDALVVGFLWIVGSYYLTYPLWWAMFHQYTYEADAATARRESVIGVPFPLGHLTIETLPGTVLVSVMGILALLAAPWCTRTVLILDRRLTARLLGPTSLTERVRDLERTRAQAVDDSTERLRRIERDLHDGAQAQLVALAMKLGLAKEKLGGPDTAAGAPDLDRAYQLVDTAHQAAKQAIIELRDLARGIRPPILDEGLDAALGALAARSEIPVRLTVDIPGRPAPAVEAIAYFCVAELLTNAVKHSHARQVTIEAVKEMNLLRLRVGDDGVGGASLDGGAGLRGLADRVRTVDGRFEVTSPAGGGTLATVYLPTQP